MNKKGMNQVEYISAMIIFLFGVVVIMYFALSFNLIQHKDYLTAVENNLKKETEITYSKYYVSNTVGGYCFNISSQSIPKNIKDYPNNLTIFNSSGNKVSYKLDNGALIVGSGADNYTFMISPNSSGPSPVSCSNPQITPNFSFEEKFKAISDDKFLQFKDNYSSYYKDLKELIAENKNFNIEIGTCPGYFGRTASRYIPRNVEVTAGEFPAKLFILPTKICDVMVTIKLWD